MLRISPTNYREPYHDSTPTLNLEIVLPEQFDELTRNTHPLSSPEKRLMLAVLQEALYCFHLGRFGKARDRRLSREAHEWFMSNDITWPCSFIPICDYLGFDPKTIRKSLTKPREYSRPRSNIGRVHSVI